MNIISHLPPNCQEVLSVTDLLNAEIIEKSEREKAEREKAEREANNIIEKLIKLGFIRVVPNKEGVNHAE